MKDNHSGNSHFQHSFLIGNALCESSKGQLLIHVFSGILLVTTSLLGTTTLITVYRVAELVDWMDCIDQQECSWGDSCRDGNDLWGPREVTMLLFMSFISNALRYLRVWYNHFNSEVVWYTIRTILLLHYQRRHMLLNLPRQYWEVCSWKYLSRFTLFFLLFFKAMWKTQFETQKVHLFLG